MTSATPWLPKLPDGWDVVQMRRVATFRNGADYKQVEVHEGGYPVYGSGGEFRRASGYLYDGISVLFGRKGTIDKPLLVSGKFWTVDTMFYTELRPIVEPRFLHYYAVTMPFGYYSTSTALPSMTQGELGGHRMPLPPLREQQAIADYLDRETAQIDTLIAKQEALIETLRERSAGVTERVLGDAVGAGNRLRWSLSEVDVRAGDAWESFPLLSVSINWGVRRRDEISNDEAKAEDLSGYKVARRGTLVVNRMRAFQGALGVAPIDGIVSPDYAVLDPAGSLDVHWLAATMRTRRFVGEMTSRLKGIGGTEGGAVRTPRINVTDLLNIEVELPPLDDQQRAIKALMDQTAKIDVLISKAGQFIALAKERRSALVIAAVTGQIDTKREVA